MKRVPCGHLSSRSQGACVHWGSQSPPAPAPPLAPAPPPRPSKARPQTACRQPRLGAATGKHRVLPPASKFREKGASGRGSSELQRTPARAGEEKRGPPAPGHEERGLEDSGARSLFKDPRDSLGLLPQGHKGLPPRSQSLSLCSLCPLPCPGGLWDHTPLLLAPAQPPGM